jgi:hypothetical protein
MCLLVFCLCVCLHVPVCGSYVNVTLFVREPAYIHFSTSVRACVCVFACVCACACDSLSFFLSLSFSFSLANFPLQNYLSFLLLAPFTARHFLIFSVTFCTQGDVVIIHMFVLYIDVCFVIRNNVYMFACMYVC